MRYPLRPSTARTNNRKQLTPQKAVMLIRQFDIQPSSKTLPQETAADVSVALFLVHESVEVSARNKSKTLFAGKYRLFYFKKRSDLINFRSRIHCALGRRQNKKAESWFCKPKSGLGRVPSYLQSPSPIKTKKAWSWMHLSTWGSRLPTTNKHKQLTPQKAVMLIGSLIYNHTANVTAMNLRQTWAFVLFPL